MPRPAYRLAMPEDVTTPVIVSSPHSGRYYSWSFMRRTVLDERGVRSSEDAFMDRLVDRAPELGAPLLVAEYPRAYLDLNRAAEELDPAVIEGVRYPTQNPRVSSGLGVIPRVVANGRMIYRGKLGRDEAERRIDTVWRPYHDCLEGLVRSARDKFGEAVLLDFHSMPHEALDSLARPGGRRPEVVLGDRFGASASPDIVEELESAFTEAGLIVSRNAPFAGAYIAQHYGRPLQGRHVVQIEIDRALYMDERLIRPNANFEAVRGLIAGVLARMIGADMGGLPLAAE
ncbi:N-formylglutamate amidohydrolase [Rhodobacterales bacterium HKCCE3408]|nr:N-formylglutamate amidohydrolase [Rhodobacterales bacterium HKCCE3408]